MPLIVSNDVREAALKSIETFVHRKDGKTYLKFDELRVSPQAVRFYMCGTLVYTLLHPMPLGAGDVATIIGIEGLMEFKIL